MAKKKKIEPIIIIEDKKMSSNSYCNLKNIDKIGRDFLKKKYNSLITTEKEWGKIATKEKVNF